MLLRTPACAAIPCLLLGVVAQGCVPSGSGTTSSSSGGAASFDPALEVRAGNRGINPVVDAPVRAVGRSGAVVDGATDTTGTAHLQLPAQDSPWTITVAKPGVGAASFVGVDGPLQGAVRLDRLVYQAGTPHTVGGAISNVDPTSVVTVDAEDFDTVTLTPGATTWQSTAYETDAAFPLTLVALELAPGGADIRNALLVPSLTRTADVTADLAFPSPPAAQVITRVTLDWPQDGAVTAGTAIPLGAPVVQRNSSVRDGAWLSCGVAQNVLGGWRVHHVSGVEPDTVVQRFAASSDYLVKVYGHSFGADHTITVGRVDTLVTTGQTLGELGVTARSAGYDALVLFVGEQPTPDGAAPWRVFAPPNVEGLQLPQLPSGVTPQSLGLTGGTVDVLPVLVAAHTARAWESPSINVNNPAWDVTVGGAYRTVANLGR